MKIKTQIKYLNKNIISKYEKQFNECKLRDEVL